MYVPKPFVFENREALLNCIDQWSFGELITCTAGKLMVNHVPLLLDKEQQVLYGHFAKQNPQWALLESADDIRIVFSGPYAYISPSWYVSKEMVPTWNFQSIQVTGKAKLLTSNELLTVIDCLSQKHEAQFENPWLISKVPEHKIQAMLKAIVGFKIEIKEIKGKSKLSQNRNHADQQGVIEGLRSQSDSMSHIIAELMAENFKKNIQD